MLIFKNQPWNIDPDEIEGSNELEWNLWTVRQRPFNLLEAGDIVHLVSGGRGDTRRITWQVRVKKVSKVRYDAHEDAWRQVQDAFRPEIREISLTRHGFLDQPYTLAAPSAGWMLAWSYEGVKQIDVPKPADLKFQPNGWLVLEGRAAEEASKRWGLAGSPPPPAGKGRAGLEHRLAVEDHAMTRAEAWLRKSGFASIKNTSARCPFDFTARKGTQTYYIEVKGTIGGGRTVVLTRREVEHATTVPPEQLVLIVVSGISIKGKGKAFAASGGQLAVHHPWNLDSKGLSPIQYDYAVPKGEEAVVRSPR